MPPRPLFWSTAIAPNGDLHTGIVESRIEATESGDSLLDHRRYLSLVSNIAVNGYGLMPAAAQCFCDGESGIVVNIC
jgi:hypothetical protein